MTVWEWAVVCLPVLALTQIMTGPQCVLTPAGIGSSLLQPCKCKEMDGWTYTIKIFIIKDKNKWDERKPSTAVLFFICHAEHNRPVPLCGVHTGRNSIKQGSPTTARSPGSSFHNKLHLLGIALCPTRSMLALTTAGCLLKHLLAHDFPTMSALLHLLYFHPFAPVSGSLLSSSAVVFLLFKLL